MDKTEVMNEIDKKIEIYQKRINTRKNQPCYFDETERIETFENEIEILKEKKELLSNIS